MEASGGGRQINMEAIFHERVGESLARFYGESAEGKRNITEGRREMKGE